jgi:hypothetical protein
VPQLVRIESLVIDPMLDIVGVEAHEAAHFDERDPSLVDQPPDVSLAGPEATRHFAQGLERPGVAPLVATATPQRTVGRFSPSC